MSVEVAHVSGISCRLQPLADAAWRRAAHEGRPIVASLVAPAPVCDPLALFSLHGLDRDGFYWEQPSEAFALVGIGDAFTTTPAGDRRFREAADIVSHLLTDAVVVDASNGARGTGPLFTGGFAFDPKRKPDGVWRGFPDARLTLPRIILTRVDERAWLTVNLVVWPDTDPVRAIAAIETELADLLCGATGAPALPGPAPAVEGTDSAVEWRALVAEAADRVRAGELEKVVLARAVRLRGEEPLPVPVALERLRAAYPTCRVFAVACNDAVFLGATPERLARLDGDVVQVDCLAGSIGRGATPEDDARLAAALLASEKDRVEHDVVARVIRGGLAGLCDDVRAPERPRLLTMANVHHLYTPVRAHLLPGRTLLDVAERLHPTPAVGGVPRESALRFIREREGLDRGWYAGPVGWVGATGGELAVGLRSGIVRGREATLFAGCGIVADSDPEREEAESGLKLRPMLAALGVPLR